MTRPRLGIAILLLVLTACAREGGTTPGSAPTVSSPSGDAVAPTDGSPMPPAGEPTVTTTAEPTETDSGMHGPPPYRLRYGQRELVLPPVSWCYRTSCVDGVPRQLTSVGNPSVVRVYVPGGWKLSASFRPTGQRCGRIQRVEPVKRGEWYVLEPAGPAGRYDVDLFARGKGDSGGDMVATFRWTTPTDGPLPTPSARAAVIATNDGQPDSYGVELMLGNLNRTPRNASAEITVTAANGRSLTFGVPRSQRPCWPEGTVYFEAAAAQGKTAAALGGSPFHYQVTVTLDGTTYRAKADYPADEIKGDEPSVRLNFVPALPAPQ